MDRMLTKTLAPFITPIKRAVDGSLKKQNSRAQRKKRIPKPDWFEEKE